MRSDNISLFKNAVAYASIAMDARKQTGTAKSPNVPGDRLPPTNPTNPANSAQQKPKCRAKDPNNCPYHHTGIYAQGAQRDAQKNMRGAQKQAPQKPKTAAKPPVNPLKGTQSVRTGMKHIDDLIKANGGNGELVKKLRQIKQAAITAEKVDISKAIAEYDMLYDGWTKQKDPALKDKLFKKCMSIAAQIIARKAALAGDAVKNAESSVAGAKQMAKEQQTAATQKKDEPMIDTSTPEGKKAEINSIANSKLAQIAASGDDPMKQYNDRKKVEKWRQGEIADVDAAAAKEEEEKKKSEGEAPAEVELPQLPSDDDEEGHKAFYQKVHDDAVAKLNEEYKSTGGKMGQLAYKQKMDAIKGDLAKNLAGVEAKFHPPTVPEDGKGEGKGAEAAAPEPKFTGHTSDEHKNASMARAKEVNAALAEFGVKATPVTEIKVTPQETHYIFKVDKSMKPSQRSDVLLKLGKNAHLRTTNNSMEMEVVETNKDIPTISYSSMMDDPELAEKASKMSVPAALGVDENGNHAVVDLAKMPHLLIGGATGQGKSAVENAILCGLMESKSPDEVEIDMIDPKGTELGVYKNMPHVRKVVSGHDFDGARAALDESVNEMKDRNELFTKLSEQNGVAIKDIEGYNKFRAAHPGMNLPNLKTRVLVIDEFSTYKSDPSAFSSITGRVKLLGEQARSAGIHLVVTTQDPTEDNIGKIKANIPARIALKTTDATKSRTILDENGAEKLTGRGDMILKTDKGKMRIKGAFVNDKAQKGAPLGTKSELEERLSKIAAKYPGKSNAVQQPAGAAPTAQPTAAATAEAGATPPPQTPPTGGSAPTATAGATPPPPPPPPHNTPPNPPKNDGGGSGEAPKAEEHPNYPNSKKPVDISHLGFFAALKAAWNEAQKGNDITYDPAGYKRMGAERWKKHLESLNGKDPDFSPDKLSSIHPLPEHANAHQKAQFKKWCALFNEADANPDPRKAAVIKKQYKNWLKDEGLAENEEDGKSSLHVNPYLSALGGGNNGNPQPPQPPKA